MAVMLVVQDNKVFVKTNGVINKPEYWFGWSHKCKCTVDGKEGIFLMHEGEPYIIFDVEDGVYQGSLKDAINAGMMVLV